MKAFLGSIRGKGEGESLREIKKRRITALIIIFMLSMRLFFSVFSGGQNVLAEAKTAEEVKNLAKLDPLSRIGEGFLADKCQNSSSLCQHLSEKEESLFFKKEQQHLLEGYPIEEMLPAINKLDKKTAEFLIAIAKKESNWGKYAPSKDGQDCYNYWGYKGAQNPTRSGYSCFDSQEQAVEIVSERISELLEKGIDTPEKMLVWKCGRTCSGHDKKDVRKWVADVELYLGKLNS
jgi:hypothetical protein